MTEWIQWLIGLLPPGLAEAGKGFVWSD